MIDCLRYVISWITKHRLSHGKLSHETINWITGLRYKKVWEHRYATGVSFSESDERHHKEGLGVKRAFVYMWLCKALRLHEIQLLSTMNCIFRCSITSSRLHQVVQPLFRMVGNTAVFHFTMGSKRWRRTGLNIVQQVGQVKEIRFTLGSEHVTIGLKCCG